jgi:DNA-binding winged helix-turn-helix (wHTH) protein
MVGSWFGHGRVRRGLPFWVVEVQLLGPLVVRVDGSVVAVRGAKERAVLSLLTLRAGSMVSADELMDALWGLSPPPSALRGLHNYVANLRRVLPAGLVVTVPGGYRADLDPEAVDPTAPGSTRTRFRPLRALTPLGPSSGRRGSGVRFPSRRSSRAAWSR